MNWKRERSKILSAVKHAESVATSCANEACGKEHAQLALWLRRFVSEVEEGNRLRECLAARDLQATTIEDNEGKRRVATCQFCFARLYFGEAHRDTCLTLTHPLKVKPC